ncbi:MAG: dCTP deaminase [Candidatus Omnitrophica bacterium]|nr:dCTP deaminase [Candidatus Omnitrophota bacterium]
MILSNKEIKRAIQENRIGIDPSPKEPFKTTSVDLRLEKRIKIPKDNLEIVVDPRGKIANTLKELYKDETIQDSGYLLEPGKFILGQTFERINLPLHPDNENNVIAARVEGKSSLARCGLLVHFTAPTIHAGFQGNITLEMINLGKYPILLRFQMPICQLIFETVLNTPDPHTGQFHGQSRPNGIVS